MYTAVRYLWPIRCTGHYASVLPISRASTTPLTRAPESVVVVPEHHGRTMLHCYWCQGSGRASPPARALGQQPKPRFTNCCKFATASGCEMTCTVASVGLSPCLRQNTFWEVIGRGTPSRELATSCKLSALTPKMSRHPRPHTGF